MDELETTIYREADGTLVKLSYLDGGLFHPIVPSEAAPVDAAEWTDEEMI